MDTPPTLFIFVLVYFKGSTVSTNHFSNLEAGTSKDFAHIKEGTIEFYSNLAPHLTTRLLCTQGAL